MFKGGFSENPDSRSLSPSWIQALWLNISVFQFLYLVPFVVERKYNTNHIFHCTKGSTCDQGCTSVARKTIALFLMANVCLKELQFAQEER